MQLRVGQGIAERQLVNTRLCYIIFRNALRLIQNGLYRFFLLVMLYQQNTITKQRLTMLTPDDP